MTTDTFTHSDVTTLPSRVARATARHLPTVARSALGLVFFVFGLDGFLHFIPAPPPEEMPPAALELGVAFFKSGYLLQLIKGTEVLGGLLLACNRFVPLALVALAPVVVNIAAFHLWLMPDGTGLSLVLVALTAYLGFAYRASFAPLLAPRARPTR